MKKKKILIENSCITYCQSDNFNANNSCLLFLHGWGQDLNSFKDIYRQLDNNGNINYIGLDFPGFGGSELKKLDLTIFDYADFTIKFIEKLKLLKPSIIGHSFGGRVAIILGAKYNNLNKIILIGAAGIKPDINILKKNIIKAGKILFSIPGFKLIGNKIKKKLGSRDYNSAGKMKNIFLNVINQDLKYLLNRINYKTLLIWGEKDMETPVNDGQLMNKLIKNSQLKIFENGTHFVFQEYSKNITELILNFYKK